MVVPPHKNFYQTLRETQLNAEKYGIVIKDNLITFMECHKQLRKKPRAYEFSVYSLNC